MLDDASYIFMGSATSTWNQIAEEVQQREGLGIKSFPERSAASVPARVNLGARQWESPLLNTVHSKKRRKYIVCDVLGLL